MIHLTARIAAPRQLVWETIVDLDRQPLWMREVTDIELVSDPPLGVGSRLRVPTRYGPIKVTDEIEVTAFEPPLRWAARHVGSLRGDGEFILVEDATGDATDVHWTERIAPPLGIAGYLVLRTGESFLRSVFQADLGRLRRLCESEARRRLRT